jgi:large subunit ribosomal protein L4|tara:strand:+ start:139 stop:777 length:639 start_codon:yes stop_codon:yes gene_type:complete
MSIKVLNIDSTGKSENLNLSEKLIGLKVNNKLLKYVVDWQLNRSKKRVAKTKQRNEVTGSTRKIYAQKGTGGARHSSRKAPLFVGGGVAHGPKGDNYKTKSINKKIRKLALAQTISKKNNNKELYILDDVKKKIAKTKIFNNFLIKNKLENVLIISDQETEKNIYKSVRNIPDVKLINYKGTNVYDLIRFKNVLFTKSSIKNIEQRLTNEKN